MIKFWRVIAYEYSRNVFRWQFLVSLLSIPVLILILSLAIFFSALPELNIAPVGYVDYAGLFNLNTVQAKEQKLDSIVEFIPYDNEEQAKQALNDQAIQSYYVIEEDYLSTKRVKLVSRRPPGALAHNLFTALVRDRLLSELPDKIAERVDNPVNLQIRSLDGTQQVGVNTLLSYFAPLITSFLLLIIAYSTSSYLMQAILEEKANRTMEILISSLSPWQLLIGKTIALTCVGLTQLLLWVMPFLILLVFGGSAILKPVSGSGIFSNSVIFILITILPSFLILASLMTSIGALVADEKEGQLFSSLFIIPPYIPIFLYRTILENPQTLLTKALSVFPLTATTTLSIRAIASPIPVNEMILILFTLILTMLGTFWIAGFAWRLGMLNYGKRITWRRLRGKPEKQDPREAVT